MKVITIKQPFASLIAEGLKEYEFRSWKSKYRGPLLIHAGKTIDKEALKRYKHLNLEYPTGCIIAITTMSDCIFIDQVMKNKLKEKDSLVYYGMIHSPNNKKYYGFKLENTQKIKPIATNGKLNFWNYEGDYELE